jgi:hypothetical protein
MTANKGNATTALGLLLACTSPAFCQGGPPPPSTLDDISGCSLENSSVFISTGRDAAAKRYKYPWDSSIDALCNAKGYAIGSPSKAAEAPPRPPLSNSPTARVPAAVPSQPGVLTEFPRDATPISAEALSRKISGKTFNSQISSGARLRLEYKANGYLFVNAPGYNVSGPWRAEESRICSQMRGSPASCNEVVERGPQLYLRRDNGEVMELNPD